MQTMNSTRMFKSSSYSTMSMGNTPPNVRNLPDYPRDNVDNPAWAIDMNYLMPFSVMLMILCVLILILCYLRHRVRQRRQLRRELRLSDIMRHTSDMGRLDEFGLPRLAGRMTMLYPPTYDEATLHSEAVIRKHTFGSVELPPPYSESAHLQQLSRTGSPGVSAETPLPTAITRESPDTGSADSVTEEPVTSSSLTDDGKFTLGRPHN